MIEFFQTFNETFYETLYETMEHIALIFPFCLSLTMIIAPIIFFIEYFKRK